MRKWDAETLIPWLTLLDFPDNNLYLAGDNIGTLMTEAGFAQRRLLSDLCGVSVTCDTFRDLGCPTGTPQDYTDCVGLDPVSGAQVADPLRSGDQLGQGNGCPDQASFDVLSPNLEANFGIPRGDEEYVGSAKTAQYASVSNRAEEFGPLSYRTVVDGISPESRRDPGACDVDAPPSSASESRLREVLEFFGYSEGGACVDPTAGTGIDMNPVQTYVTSLANFSPNPLMSGSDGKIRFTLAREGYARIDIFDINGRKVRTVFDGTATQGPNEAVWNGTDDLSRTVAGGVYFYRLRTSDQEFTSKLVVVRGGR
jgi:hypothetical protein